METWNKEDLYLRELSARVPDELVQFGKALEENSMLVDGWPYFLEKPWKWSTEYRLWIEHGRPHPDELAWANWALAVDRATR